jgi:hypothetical protein
MKNKILIAILAIAASAFTTKILTKESAIVNKEHGLFIYTDCKPSLDYELISTITSTRVNMDGQSLESTGLYYSQLKQECFRQLDQKKNKKRFAGAEALIIYPDEQRADVIKFKE